LAWRKKHCNIFVYAVGSQEYIPHAGQKRPGNEQQTTEQMKIPESQKFENPPPGSHLARCIGLVDMGTQQHKGFQGQPDWASRDVRITFELPQTKMAGTYKPELKGKPFGVSLTVKQSLHASAKLRKLLRGWRGRDFTKEELATFDLQAILDKPCFLSLVENGDYVNIDGISALPKGQVVPKRVNPLTYFSLDPAEFNAKSFSALGEKTQEKIKATPEYAALFKEQSQDAPATDEAPPAEEPVEEGEPF
jgi:hypothetical protein